MGRFPDAAPVLCVKLTKNMNHQQWRDWVSPDILVATSPHLEATLSVAAGAHPWALFGRMNEPSDTSDSQPDRRTMPLYAPN
jgi:hypothetical protein